MNPLAFARGHGDRNGYGDGISEVRASERRDVHILRLVDGLLFDTVSSHCTEKQASWREHGASMGSAAADAYLVRKS